jgi:hypothetical protein
MSDRLHQLMGDLAARSETLEAALASRPPPQWFYPTIWLPSAGIGSVTWRRRAGRPGL